MVEKQSVDVEQRPAESGIDTEVLTADTKARHGVHLAEAAELYADTRAVETYGYVARGSVVEPRDTGRAVLMLYRLKSRHVQFMGLGGSIGTALFLGIGRALAAAGPLSVFLGFTITGVGIYGMVSPRVFLLC